MSEHEELIRKGRALVAYFGPDLANNPIVAETVSEIVDALEAESLPTPPAGEPEREALVEVLYDAYGRSPRGTSIWETQADAILAAGYRRQPEPREVGNRPDSFTNAGWHVTATLDSGTDHTVHPRQYVVCCEWCPVAFWGARKSHAMARLEAHRDEMYEEDRREHAEYRTPNTEETP